jgi:hypothetical protein
VTNYLLTNNSPSHFQNGRRQRMYKMHPLIAPRSSPLRSPYPRSLIARCLLTATFTHTGSQVCPEAGACLEERRQGGQVPAQGQRDGKGHPVQSLLLDLPQDLSCSCVRKSSPLPSPKRSPKRNPNPLYKETHLANKPMRNNSLTEHAANKHSKSLTECFPNFTA